MRRIDDEQLIKIQFLQLHGIFGCLCGTEKNFIKPKIMKSEAQKGQVQVALIRISNAVEKKDLKRVTGYKSEQFTSNYIPHNESNTAMLN